MCFRCEQQANALLVDRLARQPDRPDADESQSDKNQIAETLSQLLSNVLPAVEGGDNNTEVITAKLVSMYPGNVHAIGVCASSMADQLRYIEAACQALLVERANLGDPVALSIIAKAVLRVAEQMAAEKDKADAPSDLTGDLTSDLPGGTTSTTTSTTTRTTSIPINPRLDLRGHSGLN